VFNLAFIIPIFYERKKEAIHQKLNFTKVFTESMFLKVVIAIPKKEKDLSHFKEKADKINLVGITKDMFKKKPK
jgi:hypothetical protein